MTEQQKRVIRENPHLQSGKLAKLLGVRQHTLKTYRIRNDLLGSWSYRGVGIPFLVFDESFCIRYRFKYIFSSPFLSKAIDVVDHLIWCIENGMFNMPRIENPYFDNLRFGEKQS